VAQCALLGEVQACQSLINDDHRGRLIVVARLYHSPFLEAHAESLQVIAAGHAQQCVARIARRPLSSFDSKALRITLRMERRIRSVGRALHARQRAHAVQHAVIERDALRRILVFGIRQRGAQGEEMIRPEADIDRPQARHRLQHQPRTHRQLISEYGALWG